MSTIFSVRPYGLPSAHRSRPSPVAWVVALGMFGLFFDGYDLVVYGAIVPVLLRDPGQIGAVTPQLAGTLGAFMLIGVGLGAVAAGAVADRIGRRKVMLSAYVLFSIGMGLTALSTSIAMFGLCRFLTGLGVGALMGTTGALVAEVVPAERRNLYTGIVYSGIALGAVFSAIAAIVVLAPFGWRPMFWIGALPLVALLPLAYFRMPESVAWLLARGRDDEARVVAKRYGLPMPAPAVPVPGVAQRFGFAGLLGRDLIVPTVLLGLVTMTALMLTFCLNTWLPEIMMRSGFAAKGSLAFLLVLNGGGVAAAILGSMVADRCGSAKVVVALTFGVGALSAALLTLELPVAVLLLLVGTVGLGTGGAQLLVYTFAANYYPTSVRAAGVASAAVLGRLGAIGGPVVGSALIAAGLPLQWIFYVLAGAALLAGVLMLLIPAAPVGSVPTPRISPTTSLD